MTYNSLIIMKMFDPRGVYEKKDDKPVSDQHLDILKNEALRELGDLYEKLNPNQRPDLPRDTLEPKLNLFKCPYEHRVVPYKNLHPQIRAYIDLIKKMTWDRRITASSQLLCGLGVIGLLGNSTVFLGASLGLNIGYYLGQRKQETGPQGQYIALKITLASGLDREVVNQLLNDIKKAGTLVYFLFLMLYLRNIQS